MPLFLITFFKSYYKQIFIGLLIVGCVLFLWGLLKAHDAGVYKKGVTDTTLVYEAKIKEYDDNLNLRIKNIEGLSTVIIQQNEANAVAASKDISKILLAVKNKPLYKIVDGNCLPSPDFINTYNSVVQRANTK